MFVTTAAWLSTIRSYVYTGPADGGHGPGELESALIETCRGAGCIHGNSGLCQLIGL